MFFCFLPLSCQIPTTSGENFCLLLVILLARNCLLSHAKFTPPMQSVYNGKNCCSWFAEQLDEGENNLFLLCPGQQNQSLVSLLKKYNEENKKLKSFNFRSI